MELLAVIIGLEALKQPNRQVTVYSDSRYVVDAIEKGWVFGWEKKGFKDKKNPDFMETFFSGFPPASGKIDLDQRSRQPSRKRTLRPTGSTSLQNAGFANRLLL